MNLINDFLEKLGLSEIETKLYLGLLEKGPTTVLEISRHTGIKRATTHFNIESLIQKGLVTQTSVGARRQIIAEPPQSLEILVEQHLSDAKNLKQNLPSVIDLVASNYPKYSQQEDVHVKYYAGKQAVKSIYTDVLRSKEIRTYVNATAVAKVFPENMELFIKAHNKHTDMRVWEIMDKSSYSEEYANQMVSDRYFYKFIPETLDLSVIDYMIYDGKVAIVNIKEDASGLIFSNEDYYNNAKAIFDFVWNMISSKS